MGRRVTTSTSPGISLPRGTTAQRPASATAGDIRYNTDRNYIEFYNGTSWQVMGALEPVVTTTSVTAVNGQQIFVDTNGGAVTVTLPATPSVGDTVRFFDLRLTFDTNNLTVGRNGSLIQGDSADLTVATEGAAFDLIYSGDTYGWRIFSI